MIRSRIGLYAAVSIVFWLLAFAVWDGTASSGSETVRLGWRGAAFNALLLVPLSKGRSWAKWLLLAEATIAAIFVASLGLPPFGGPSFGVLAFVACAQVGLLLLFDPHGRPSRRAVSAR